MAPPRATWEAVVADGNGVPRWVEDRFDAIKDRFDVIDDRFDAQDRALRETSKDVVDIKIALSQQREKMLGWARLQGTMFGALVTILVALLVNWLTKKS